eukprot:395965-Prymnesium_polylepis.1
MDSTRPGLVPQHRLPYMCNMHMRNTRTRTRTRTLHGQLYTCSRGQLHSTQIAMWRPKAVNRPAR